VVTGSGDGSVDLGEALQPLIDIVRADGADMRLVEQSEDAVGLQLDIKDATCAECVMPRQFLEGVVLTALQESQPWVRHVSIRDPREEGGSELPRGAG
jgi:hypothetical protein